MARTAKAGSPRAYVLWGQDELRKREALQALIATLVPLEDRELDVEYLDAGNPGTSGDSILHAARDRAMFSERRVVVVLNASRLRSPRHTRTQETLAAGIPTLPDFSTLILVVAADDGEERRARTPFGEKLMAAVKAHGKIEQFAAPKPEELAQLAIREAAAHGKTLHPAAASQLVQRIGPDSLRTLQEVRKLAAYAGERPMISPADVGEMIPAPPDDNIFHLLDATMNGDRRQALEVLGQLRQSGMAVPQILVMLARTLRQVAQAKFLADQRVQPTAEAADLSAELLELLPEDGNLYRSTKDWQRKKLWGQARRVSWDHLHRALDRLAVTDAGTKGWEQGVDDPDLALELFVAHLCAGVQAAPAAPPSRPYGRHPG